MLNIKELLEQVVSLPIEERVSLVDTLLKSLNTPNEEIDLKWIKVAKRRLGELRSGKVQPIPGHEVFRKVEERFAE